MILLKISFPSRSLFCDLRLWSVQKFFIFIKVLYIHIVSWFQHSSLRPTSFLSRTSVPLQLSKEKLQVKNVDFLYHIFAFSEFSSIFLFLSLSFVSLFSSFFLPTP
ncbi:hypothetical protein I3843_04G050400 [Carya illinoinensis]|uniref:Uncharacterized protein n=1 Tax=Carya illinoinensis TaxID=32201 RepID=A0A922F9R9_CARIL|nr:hypothetical protein I3760_04G054600 [Carya illinoinensis]KAG6716561.1 hypothetical protein I3842_04G055200 [Carya illinoinensis]KAG7982397.1 hypothetical protein I3843_04G050400 [Carya illinoinensis]